MIIWWVFVHLLALFGLAHLVREVYESVQLSRGRGEGQGISILCLLHNQENNAEAIVYGFMRLLAQKLPRSLWEIVLLDLNSKDNTGNICRRFAVTPGIKFLQLNNPAEQDPVQAGRLLCDFPTVVLLDATYERSSEAILANLRQALEPLLPLQRKNNGMRGMNTWNSS